MSHEANITKISSGEIANYRATLAYRHVDVAPFDRVLAQLEEAERRCLTLEQQRDHWKANHDEAIARQRLLIDRPDLPVERVRAHEEMRRLQVELSELKRSL